MTGALGLVTLTGVEGQIRVVGLKGEACFTYESQGVNRGAPGTGGAETGGRPRCFGAAGGRTTARGTGEPCAWDDGRPERTDVQVVSKEPWACSQESDRDSVGCLQRYAGGRSRKMSAKKMADLQQPRSQVLGKRRPQLVSHTCILSSRTTCQQQLQVVPRIQSFSPSLSPSPKDCPRSAHWAFSVPPGLVLVNLGYKLHDNPCWCQLAFAPHLPPATLE